PTHVLFAASKYTTPSPRARLETAPVSYVLPFYAKERDSASSGCSFWNSFKYGLEGTGVAAAIAAGGWGLSELGLSVGSLVLDDYQAIGAALEAGENVEALLAGIRTLAWGGPISTGGTAAGLILAELNRLLLGNSSGGSDQSS
ncbi:MAG TPA: hypothetical protein VMH41_13635, partial [Mycobacteriales bacterium]|nr:hypothetical protein [Mycobacteriales bacterium]